MKIIRDTSYRQRESKLVISSMNGFEYWSKLGQKFCLTYKKVSDFRQPGVTCDYHISITVDELLRWISVLLEAAKKDPALKRRLAKEFGRMILKWFRFAGS